MNTTSETGHMFPYPDYMNLYPWEGKTFDFPGWQSWMRNNRSISLIFVSVYLISIFVGRQWMKSREPYSLRGSLFLWNFGLAVYSGMTFVRTVPELLHLMGKEGGFHESICTRDTMTISTVFWSLLFTWSKVAELGDTLFIVLRKTPLIVLHWYHHISVLLYCWFTWADHDAGHRWFMTINAFIHSVMYSYYAAKAVGVKFPRNLAMLITFSQLAQMIFGVIANIYALNAKGSGMECQTETLNIKIALAMYASYAVLFANFMNKTYFQKKKVKTQ